MLGTWKDFSHCKVICVKARIEETVRVADCKSKTVIDVGSGDGFLSKALIEAGAIVTSVEPNEQARKNAEETFGINSIDGNIQDIAYQDNFFDIAIAGEVLEHVENPFKALSELFRIAREKVVVSMPVGEYFLGDPTHKWKIDLSTIKHDCGSKKSHDKEILILTFTKRK